MKFARPSKKTKALLLSGVALFVLSAFGSFSGANRATYDAFSKIAARDIPQDENIVLVTVDAETVARYGEESFWTRTRYKALLDQIEEAWAKAVYFDYYFSEKTRPENVDWDLLQETAKLPQESLDESYVAYSKAIKSTDFISEIDFDFARAIKRYGNVYLPKLLRSPSSKTSSTETVAEPLGIFANNARVGFANVPLDTDGVERRAYGKIGNEIPVPFLLAEVVTGKKPDMRLSSNGTYSPKFSGAPYSSTFPAIPFEYAQNGKMTDRVGNPVSLSGKIIIVGDYGETLWDLHAVPTGGKVRMAGMELLAHHVKSIIDGTTLSETSVWVRFAMLAFTALGFVWAYSLAVSSMAASALAILGILGAFGTSYLAFGRGVWIPPVEFALSGVLPFFGWAYAAYRQVREDREKVHKIFSRYVSPSVVETLVRQGTETELAGETREVSVLFADVQGFTTLSENLSPKETVARLNRVFSEINRTVFERSGTINKYVGDAVMAFWGAPADQNDHAVRSVRAALEIAERTKKADAALRIRMGIATGNVLVGNVGDERFSDYTVMGDRVNFASRLEGITRYYGTDVLVSKKTYALAKNAFLFREVDSIRVKGKTVAESVYEPLRLKNATDRGESDRAERHAKALALYRKGNFKAAEKEFSFNSLNGDAVAEAFLKRIEDWEGIPPRNFDGSHSFDTK